MQEKKQKATSASSIDLLVSWGNEKPPSPAPVLFLAKLSSPVVNFKPTTLEEAGKTLAWKPFIRIQQ
ncbi:hypothetical protein ACNR90_002188 [Candidozyma auris]